MNVKRARELLIKAAHLNIGESSSTLENAAMTFSRAKQRNADRRDRWKVKKRLTVSREDDQHDAP